jgi:hypothetical protein
VAGHLNAKEAQLDLGNIVTGSPPHSPGDRGLARANGVSPSASGGYPSPSAPSSLRSMSDTRKAKFRKLLDQQVVAISWLPCHDISGYADGCHFIALS